MIADRSAESLLTVRLDSCVCCYASSWFEGSGQDAVSKLRGLSVRQPGIRSSQTRARLRAARRADAPRR